MTRVWYSLLLTAMAKNDIKATRAVSDTVRLWHTGPVEGRQNREKS